MDLFHKAHMEKPLSPLTRTSTPLIYMELTTEFSVQRRPFNQMPMILLCTL